MSNARLKLLIWLLALSALLCVALAGARGAAELLAMFQRGADPASALNIVPNRPPDTSVVLRWLPDAGDIGRVPDDFEREQIEIAYRQAWFSWSVGVLRADDKGLLDSFTGPALAQARAAMASSTADGRRVTRIATTHNLRLTFLSINRAIAAITDEGVSEITLVHDRRGALISASETRSTYDVVMILEDGRWRIRHLTRTAAAPPAPPPAAQPLPGMVAASGRALLLGGQPFTISGINYYPQATPWDRFWPSYRPAVIDSDFARIRGLGLNTVRIFIPYEGFGGAQVEPLMLERLGDLLDRADAHGLKVIVTLFDFRGDYSPLLWGQSSRHLATIMSRFSQHRAILAWDLKNEPDLDYRSAGRESVDMWLAHSLRLAREQAPHQLITVGWSSAAAAVGLADMVDLVSFHDYLPPEELGQRYAALRAAVPDRPIVLQEYGLPTWNSPLFPGGHTEAEQERYYAAAVAALRASDMAGGLAWTLYDFRHVPATVAGRWPWQTGPQGAMGVLRADASAKPAARLLAPGADLTVAPGAWWDRLRKPFWALTVGGALLLVALVALVRAVGWVRRERRFLRRFESWPHPTDLALAARRRTRALVIAIDEDIAVARRLAQRVDESGGRGGSGAPAQPERQIPDQ